MNFIEVLNGINRQKQTTDVSLRDYLQYNNNEFLAEDMGNGELRMFIKYCTETIKFDKKSFIEIGGEIKKENRDIGWNFECFKDVYVCATPKPLKSYCME